MITAIRKYSAMAILLFFWSWCMSVDDIRDGIGDVAKTGRAALGDTITDVWDEFDIGELEWN